MSNRTKNIISVSDAAASYICNMATSDVSGLHISVTKGGCSGHEYAFSFTGMPEVSCETVIDKGVTLYIDRTAILYIIGSELDYTQDDFSEKLFFKNPNETGACGCGKSVSFS